MAAVAAEPALPGFAGGFGGFGGGGGGGGSGYAPRCRRGGRLSWGDLEGSANTRAVAVAAVALAWGAPSFSNGGSLTLVNDTFAANSASGGTGGQSQAAAPAAPSSQFNGTLTAVFVTFSGNIAQDGTGDGLDGTDVYVVTDATDAGVRGSSASVTLTDDILGQASSPTADFVANNVGGSTPTMNGTNDLISNNSPGTGTGFTGSSPLLDDPTLGPLAYNGGPASTMAHRDR